MNYRQMMQSRYNQGPGWDDYTEDEKYSMPYYRYQNAYGNYRGGYNMGNQGSPPFRYGPPPGPPMPPMGPQFYSFSAKPQRRDFGGDGISRKIKRDKAIKHLIKCGLPKQQVLKLPHDLIVLMNPMNCGLCGTQFELFELSKIHYLSKNHAKNIKKWLVAGKKEPKEPFRPRESYCELCDVEITSKEHATSHYCGKNHRAVVEGRKICKNPILLQPNMKNRMRILIRREKKFFKTLEPDAEKPNSKPDPTTVPPELYCSICKAIMSCSEQMTTHLNGKRHLAKEKQHILKLMKGETSDNNANADNEEAEDKEDEEDFEEDKNEDVDGEGGEEAKDAEDGWGSGGEDWKPSAEDY